MRLLVTGGAGFIGSHIADRASARGWSVTVIDDLSSGRRENVPAAADFEQVDIRDRDAIFQIVHRFQPDAISHHAAQASVAVSVRDPRLDAEINVTGSIHLLDAARAVGTRCFVFASTGGAIYGEVPDGHLADIDTLPAPLSPYAVSKYSVENYLRCYHSEHGLEYRILRYANVYGPRQDPHGEAGVVAIFLNRLLEGTSVQINARREKGDDGCVRDYVFVDDVVAANLAVLEGTVTDPISNVCTGVATATRQLARRIEQSLGVEAELTFADRRAGDLERSVLKPHARIAADSLTSLDQGLAHTAKWFQERRNA